MTFTGTKQEVKFTSKHVHKVLAEPKINNLDRSEQVSEQPQKRRTSPEPEELNTVKVRRVLDFNVASPPTSLTQTQAYHLLQRTHSNRAQHLIMPMTPWSLCQIAQRPITYPWGSSTNTK